MATVLLIGTFDTKGAEYGYLSERVRDLGCEVLTVDVGVLGGPRIRADVSRAEVAASAGANINELANSGDRGAAVETMARGAAEVVRGLYEESRFDAIFALGGSGGSSLAAQAMHALPVGIPKMIVSTVAAGDTRPYVGGSDITLMYSVVDIAGINRISERILANSAAAIAGMAKTSACFEPTSAPKLLVGATMFGVTTPCVDAARARLEELGYEVLVFHATGAGGRSMEALMRDGFITGALDITTTELADELVGGVLSAGPDRLETAGAIGIPQVVSLGALDMVNFGPIESVPERFRDRKLYKHNPAVTLMRTTLEECAELGRRIARKLNAAKGPVTLFIPLRGVSLIDTESQVFYDPEADAALFDALRGNLEEKVEMREIDTDINDPEFARALADRLHERYRISTREREEARE
jgi:uncharacterized protein (UPF0261 family)